MNEQKDGYIDKLKKEYFAIEERTDLSDGQKVTRIINITASVCAGVATQPIPFADIFILTPIQAFMGTRIAAVRGVPVSGDVQAIIDEHQELSRGAGKSPTFLARLRAWKRAATMMKEVLGAMGLGFAAQQTAIGLYKAGLPFLGGFMTIPLVYGLTYGIGRAMDHYFMAKARGETVSPEILKQIWEQAKAEGKEAGEKAGERGSAPGARPQGGEAS